MMKLLAISDTYIPPDFMKDGLACLSDYGIEVEVRHWHHENLIGLQEDNLAIEMNGPEAVELSNDITDGLDEFDIVVVQFAPISKSFIEKATKLKLIGVLRTGTENLAVDFATGRQITILNTLGRNARAVAECTMGLMLSEIRNIARAHACLMNNNWQRNFPNSDAIPELCGKTVGLVGFGAVARLVAGYLEAFGSNIVAFDPFFKGDPAPATLVDLDTLLTTSDIVSIHARLCDETYHMIGEKEISKMKGSAVIVNTARSGLIDEKALIAALEKKQICGAALDVFDDEPLPEDSAFTKLDNVTLSPHIAGSTIDAFKNSPKRMADIIISGFEGNANMPVVNNVPFVLKANR